MSPKKKHTLAVLLTISVLAPLAFWASGRTVDVPPFAIALKLSPNARERLRTIGEPVEVLAMFDGDGLPGLLLGEGVFVGIIWGIPLWLTVRTWRLFKKHQTGDGVRLALSCLVLSEAFLLLVGILVAIKAMTAITVPFGPQGVAFLNLLLCGTALTSSLLSKSAWPPQVQRAVIGASVYMIFVWVFAMFAR